MQSLPGVSEIYMPLPTPMPQKVRINALRGDLEPDSIVYIVWEFLHLNATSDDVSVWEISKAHLLSPSQPVECCIDDRLELCALI